MGTELSYGIKNRIPLLRNWKRKGCGGEREVDLMGQEMTEDGFTEQVAQKLQGLGGRVYKSLESGTVRKLVTWKV